MIGKYEAIYQHLKQPDTCKMSTAECNRKKDTDQQRDIQAVT
jgi:hypothetical protein